MIEFLTLFLTIVAGGRPVAVTVDPAVTMVEFQLDGNRIVRLHGPPWETKIDLGPPMPHELTAVAFDSDGQEVGRVSQRINFGPYTAEARLALLRQGDDPPTQARLIWETFDQREPKRIQARFDGQKASFDRTGNEVLITIPPHDPDFPHLLEAELEFQDKVHARADLPFGGRYGDRVTSDLTAVPLLLPDGMPLPDPEEVRGWLRVDGHPVPVFAVRREPATVFVVRDLFLRKPLPISAADKHLIRQAPKGVSKEDDVYFLLTVPWMKEREDGATAIFAPQRVRRAHKAAGLDYILRHQGTQGSFTGDPQHLMGAVLSAGQAAAQAGRPRAVVLLVDGQSDDASQLLPQHVRSYLAVLRVPIFVWSHGEGPRTEAAAILHGTTREYAQDSLSGMLTALDHNLRRQAIVWLEGRFLPQAITLSSDAPQGVAFAR